MRLGNDDYSMCVYLNIQFVFIWGFAFSLVRFACLDSVYLFSNFYLMWCRI